ncbi:MAG: hypothetical protein ACYDCX_01105 [Acidithiobacillus sp.]
MLRLPTQRGDQLQIAVPRGIDAAIKMDIDQPVTPMSYILLPTADDEIRAERLQRWSCPNSNRWLNIQ